MQLAHIDFDKLSVSPLNMRHARRAPDISDILPSIRAHGVLVPLLVRPNGEPDRFEIVAGRRRYFSSKAVLLEAGEISPLPCAIYETFTRLIREGRTVQEIATTFGLTEIQVKQRLALSNLLLKIRDAYQRDEIDVQSIRHLTLATKSQQQAWLALFQDETADAPIGSALKQWLFGGQSISTKAALFPLDEYTGEIVTDLFGEEGYFADKALFWEKQNAAIANKRQSLIDAGWKGVEVMTQGERFHTWEHERITKKKGGKVFIEVIERGEVPVSRGLPEPQGTGKEDARNCRRQLGNLGKGSPSRSTGPMQACTDLHRHAAVRNALADHGQVALRLMLAHVIASADLWQVRREPQCSRHDAIDASVAGCPAETAFTARRPALLAALALPEDRETVTSGDGDSYLAVAIFMRLLSLSDEAVLRFSPPSWAKPLLPGVPLSKQRAYTSTSICRRSGIRMGPPGS